MFAFYIIFLLYNSILFFYKYENCAIGALVENENENEQLGEIKMEKWRAREAKSGNPDGILEILEQWK